MPNTFIKIASVTVGAGGAASISFSSIPSTYTDLCVLLSARDTATNGTCYPTFNGVSTNLSMRVLEGNGSSASSSAPAGFYFPITGSGQTSNTFANSLLYYPNYNGSSFKSISVDSVTENNATAAFTDLVAGLWSNTAAITSLGFLCNTAFAQYSTAVLYGIKSS